MPLTVLVDRENRIAISHAGTVGLLVFEADINPDPGRCKTEAVDCANLLQAIHQVELREQPHIPVHIRSTVRAEKNL